uniref:EF-hand domain-containing protein n=1 Tax=Anguilla anguilla TaxID=7936 RepID=A0A0E9X4G6_ANGAN
MAYPGYGGYGAMPGQGMQMHGGMMGGPPQGGFPGQGGYHGTFAAPSPAVNDPMWGYFTAIAGQDGEVDAEELQRCLTQSGFSGSYNPFSLETCRIMIAMLDRDMDGKDGIQRVQRAFHGSERLEAELHDVRPGQERHDGAPRAGTGHHLHGLQAQPSRGQRHHEALQQGRQDLLR